MKQTIQLCAGLKISVAPAEKAPGMVAVTMTKGPFAFTEHVAPDVVALLAVALIRVCDEVAA